MIVTACNNSEYHPSGAGYALRLNIKDRNKYFKREWSSVVLSLEGQGECVVNVSNSFWKTINPCTELRKKEIGIWLIHNGKARWLKGCPPEMRMKPLGVNKFEVEFT